MKPDQTFNEKMKRTSFGRVAGAHNDSFVPRNSNLPHGTFETKWTRLGDKLVGWGAAVLLIVLIVGLWRGWIQ